MPLATAIPDLQPRSTPPALSPEESDRLYAFITTAHTRLAAGTAPPDARWKLLQCYLRLGIGAAALELFESNDSADPEQAGLIAAIPRGQGHQSWGACQTRFLANLEAWAARGGAAEQVAQAWRAERSRYSLFADALGNSQVRRKSASGLGVWLPFVGAHARIAEMAPLPADSSEFMPGPYLFEGLDLGWYFARLWRKTQNTFWGYSSALYAIEPDPALIAVVFHLHDWRPLLSDERVFLFVGEDAAARVNALLREHPALGLPRQVYQLSTHRAPPQPRAVEVVKELIAHRSARVAITSADVGERYRGRDFACWARRFEAALAGQAPPLRILGVVSTHTSFLQYSMRDAQAAARRMGHDFRVITEEKPYEKPGIDAYHTAIAQFEPDLFLMIDHLRAEWGDALPAGLPVLTWDQDALPHVFTHEHIRGMGALDIVVGLPQIGALARMGADPRQFLAVPMPTCPAQWDSTVLEDEDLAAHAADIAYVSHGAATPEDMIQGEVSQCQDATLQRLLQSLGDAMLALVPPHQAPTGTGLRQVYAEAERRAGVRVNDRRLRERLFGWHLWRWWDRRFRHEILSWAARYATQRGRALRLYGAGWERHPTLAPFACGPAHNGAELLAIYRAAAINLQIMPAGFLHQRALDGMAAGAFFLTPALESDACTPDLRDVAALIVDRGWRSVSQLRSEADAATMERFARLQAAIGFDTGEDEEAFHHIRCYVDWPYPREAFADFPSIAFCGEADFVARADHFLDHADERRAIAGRMRQVVHANFSYDAAIKRFLHFAANYFRQRASEMPSAEPNS